MAEYSANAIQTVAPNEAVIFTESPVPCTRGLIYHREESGIFRLASPVAIGCPCVRGGSADYTVSVHANIAVPAGGTAEAIQLAIVIDGETDPSSIMIFTPADVDEYGNVGAEIIVAVPSICRCSSVSVRNVSTQDVNVQNANIVFSYNGVRR